MARETLSLTAAELQFAALQGVVARRALTAKLSDCPYGRPGSGRSAGDNVRAVLWRWGFKGALSRPSVQGSRRSDASPDARAVRKRAGADATVSRGTRDADPRGRPWTRVQLQVLRHCRGIYSDGEIAAMVGRSHQAVRNRLTRMRQEEGERAAPRLDAPQGRCDGSGCTTP